MSNIYRLMALALLLCRADLIGQAVAPTKVTCPDAIKNLNATVNVSSSFTETKVIFTLNLHSNSYTVELLTYTTYFNIIESQGNDLDVAVAACLTAGQPYVLQIQSYKTGGDCEATKILTVTVEGTTPVFSVPATNESVEVTSSDVTADKVTVYDITINNTGLCTNFTCDVNCTNLDHVFHVDEGSMTITTTANSLTYNTVYELAVTCYDTNAQSDTSVTESFNVIFTNSFTSLSTSTTIPATTSTTSAIPATTSTTSEIPATTSTSSAISATTPTSSALPATTSTSSAIPATTSATSEIPATTSTSSAIPATTSTTSAIPAATSATSEIPATTSNSSAIQATTSATSEMPATSTTSAIPATTSTSSATSPTALTTSAIQSSTSTSTAASSTRATTTTSSPSTSFTAPTPTTIISTTTPTSKSATMTFASSTFVSIESPVNQQDNGDGFFDQTTNVIAIATVGGITLIGASLGLASLIYRQVSRPSQITPGAGRKKFDEDEDKKEKYRPTSSPIRDKPGSPASISSRTSLVSSPGSRTPVSLVDLSIGEQRMPKHLNWNDF